MRLKYVTMTGADNSIDPNKLKDISFDFPFVEWGILFSKSKKGKSRYPSSKWIKSFLKVAEKNEINISCHICGSWIDDILNGDFTMLKEIPEVVKKFKRIQLNFHGGSVDKNNYQKIFDQLSKLDAQYIFQVDNADNELFNAAVKYGLNASCVFDLSHGTGVSPDEWPEKAKGQFCGYAGGLGPDNIREQLIEINKITDDIVWIDMETKIRSDDDKKFDMSKVVTCLKASSQYVSMIPLEI